LIHTYCKAAEEIKTTPWKQCQFLNEDESCDFSGSCDAQIDEKQWKWLRSQNSQQLRSSPDPGKPADELEIAKSGITASPSQVEAEKEKKEK